MTRPPSPRLVPTHINIVTRDIEASWAFYSDVLGVRYLGRFSDKKFVGRFGDFDFFVEEVPDFSPQHASFHLGFRTTPEGVYRWDRRLKRKGVPLVRGNNPSAEVFALPGTNRVAVYFADPDGTVIEIYSDE